MQIKHLSEKLGYCNRAAKKICLLLTTFAFSMILMFTVTEYVLLPAIKYQKRPHSQIFSNEEFIQSGDYRNFFTLDLWEIWKPRPNTSIVPDYWETDRRGFRLDPTNRQELSTSQNSILVIGDSFAYGHGVSHQESWPAVLETLLNKEGKNTPVYNAGVPATGTDQQYVRLINLTHRFKPNVVLWMVSLNDVQDNKFSCLFRKVRNGSYVQLPAILNIAYINASLVKYLPNFWVTTKTGNLLSTITIQGRDLHTVGCSDTKLSDDQNENLYFEKLTYLVGKATATLANLGIKLVFILTPYQAYFDHSYDNNRYEVKMVNKFREIFSDYRLVFIDLNSEISRLNDPTLFAYRQNGDVASVGTLDVLGSRIALEANANPQLNFTLYLDEHESFAYGGWHLNPEGNARVAAIIYEKLSKNF